jgi:subtilisin family serine protease
MKAILYITRNIFIPVIILAALFSVKGNAQQTRSLNGKQYVQSDSKWYQVEGGKHYEVNTSVITVKMKQDVSLSQANVLNNSQGAQVLRTNILGYTDFKIAIPGDVFQVTQNYINSGLVETAELNAFGEYVATANDTYYSNQWALNNTGQTGGTSDADMDAAEAWNITTGSSSVIVGILDSGTDWMHEDIGFGADTYQNVYLNPGEDAWSDSTNPSTGNNIDDDGNGLIDDWKGWDFYNNNNDSRGPYFHGTHVAGIVSAKTNNSKGIAGVAGGWNTQGARLLIAGVGDDYPDESILDDAILYAASKQAKIITMSLSVPQTSAIDAALASAYLTYGCFIDCAAGNTYGGAVTYPATNQYVVAVTATDHNDSWATYSSKGPEVALSAPGTSIYSTQPGNTYGYSSGTSFAAPQVAGAAALMLSKNSNLTPLQVRKTIEHTSEDKGASGRDDYYGWGRVNAYYALLAVVGPQNFRTTNPNNSNVSLAWDPIPASVLQHYEIERNINSWGWTLIATTTNTSYTDNEFQRNKTGDDFAQYRIRSKTIDNVYSLYSNILTVDGTSFWQQKRYPAAHEMPTEYYLSQNYPNPFNPSTIIRYALPKNSFVTLKIFDVLGKEIATLVNEEKAAGFYDVEFNASHLSSGIYFYRLIAPGVNETRKMLIAK